MIRQRAAAALGDAFNAVSRDAGFVLDWMERDGFVVRELSARDHARFHAMLWSIVQITESPNVGRVLQRQVRPRPDAGTRRGQGEGFPR
jgi:hypothetical protein